MQDAMRYGVNFSIIVNPLWEGWAMNPKIVPKSLNNILLKSFWEVSAYIREVSVYFREVYVYFREVSAYFHMETSFLHNLETSFESFGATTATRVWGLQWYERKLCNHLRAGRRGALKPGGFPLWACPSRFDFVSFCYFHIFWGEFSRF